jgi:hypothetical protein
MLRPIVSATLLALLAAPVLAQTPASTAPSQLDQVGLNPPTVLSRGYAAGGEDVLVTGLLNQPVYASAVDSAEVIGTITDMVVTSGRGISAVVISVGGFLGVGEKEVAIDFAQLEWAEGPDGERRWILGTTAEALATAPAFIWSDSEAATGVPALTPEQEEQQLVGGDPNSIDVDPALTTDQTERTVVTGAPDRTGMADFDEAGLAAADLIGIGVYGVNDEQIGTIGDIVVDTEGSVDAVVVDVGGFLGIGAKPVAVGFDDLAFSVDTFGNRYLFLNTTRDQLERQPQYDPATYPAQRDAQRMVISP